MNLARLKELRLEHGYKKQQLTYIDKEKAKRPLAKTELKNKEIASTK
ncbi:hypothetical protein Q3304_09270 [Clostridioides sp. GD02377]